MLNSNVNATNMDHKDPGAGAPTAGTAPTAGAAPKPAAAPVAVGKHGSYVADVLAKQEVKQKANGIPNGHGKPVAIVNNGPRQLAPGGVMAGPGGGQIAGYAGMGGITPQQLEKMGVKRGSMRHAVDTANSGGRTALMFASCNGHLETVKVLVLEANADVDAEDNHGTTSLMFAAARGHLPVVKFLVLEGKASIETRDDCYKTAADRAKETCNYHIAEFLNQQLRIQQKQRELARKEKRKGK
uniref:Uncharacterized protein n=2 Tax=Lotharella globosa TaxID=91324 RepID=A0A7S4DMH6_9EUKA